jgi:hypothetical protein
MIIRGCTVYMPFRGKWPRTTVLRPRQEIGAASPSVTTQTRGPHLKFSRHVCIISWQTPQKPNDWSSRSTEPGGTVRLCNIRGMCFGYRGQALPLPIPRPRPRSGRSSRFKDISGSSTVFLRAGESGLVETRGELNVRQILLCTVLSRPVQSCPVLSCAQVLYCTVPYSVLRTNLLIPTGDSQPVYQGTDPRRPLCALGADRLHHSPQG